MGYTKRMTYYCGPYNSSPTHIIYLAITGWQLARGGVRGHLVLHKKSQKLHRLWYVMSLTVWSCVML